MKRTVEFELNELKGVFPKLKLSDFYELENGNIGVLVAYHTTGTYGSGTYEVIIEFPLAYPNIAPFAWITSPEIRKGITHIHRRDEYGHVQICYLHPKKDWHYTFTSYDAAMMIQTWIYAYSYWLKTGVWNWEQAD